MMEYYIFIGVMTASLIFFLFDLRNLTRAHERGHRNKARALGVMAVSITIDRKTKGIIKNADGEYSGSRKAVEKVLGGLGLSLGDVGGICFTGPSMSFKDEMQIVKAGPLASILRELENTLLLGFVVFPITASAVFSSGNALLYVYALLGLLPLPVAYIAGSFYFRSGRLKRAYEHMVKAGEGEAFEICAGDGEKIFRKKLYKQCFDLYQSKKLHPITDIELIEKALEKAVSAERRAHDIQIPHRSALSVR